MFCAACGAELPDNANFCLKCGHQLKDLPARVLAGAPRHETKEFLVPLAGLSGLRSMPVERFKDLPVNFLRAAGVDARESFIWANGWIAIWEANRLEIIERLNELGNEGWQLAQPLDLTPHPPYQRQLDWVSAFAFDEITVPWLFGSKKKLVVKGVNLVMKRTVFE